MKTGDLSENGARRKWMMASIRQNLAASRPFDTNHQKHLNSAGFEPDQSSAVADHPFPDPVENFKASLTLVGGHFRLVRDLGEAARETALIIEKAGAGAIAISDSELVDAVVSRIPNSRFQTKVSSAELFRCDLGITSAQWAIAETGTLVLESDQENHRLTSLIPPIHICLVRADFIRQTLGEILALTSRNLSRAITFITGASRTSDIELTLAIGVHGPRELHVIVLDGE